MSIARLLAGRAIAGVLVLGSVALVVFGLLAAQPGDAAARRDDPRLPPEARAALRAQLSLDRPWSERLGRMAGDALHGDLGWSVARAQPVRDAVARALGPSLVLGLSGLLLGLTTGLLLGTWQGHALNSPTDRWTSRLALLLVAIPDFWLALMLLTLGAKVAGWFPVGGWPRDGRLTAQLWHLCLPALTLALLVAARVSRFHRAGVAAARGATWARAARGRGLPDSHVRWRHVARAAAAPTIALTGLLIPMMIAGTVFVEIVFAWPGVGRLLLDAVQARDIPLAVGATLVTAVFAVIGSTAADVVQAALDPRTRQR